MRITAYIPPECANLAVDKLKSLVMAALDQPTDLPPAPDVGWIRRPTYLVDIIATRIQNLVETTGDTAGKIYGRLLCAGMSAEKNAIASKNALPSPLVTGRTWRPEQKLIIDRCMADIANRQIALCEAATGTGKGYAIGVIANQSVDLLQLKPVIIASPTLAILRQNWEEWRATGSKKKVAIVLGRNQFVDPSTIENLLNNGYEDEGVRKWLLSGGGDTGNTSTKALRVTYPEIQWLADDLSHVAADFPIEDARLDENACSQSMFWYNTMRESATEADIIFCTHAMIAFDNQLRCRKTSPSQILPDAKLLLIDEGHQFEQAVANAASHGLALSKLRFLLSEASAWATLKLATKAREAMAECDKLILSAKRIPEDHVFAIDTKNDKYCAHRLDFERSASALLTALKTISSKKLESSSEADLMRRRFQLTAAIRTLETVISGKQRVQLSFAPIRRYPTISAGPLSVRHLLLSLWERTPSAALFSATICLPTQTGAINDSYFKTILALPRERVSSHDPIIPSWVTKDVTLHLPSPARAGTLIPPSRDLSDEERDNSFVSWAGNIGLVIERVVLPRAKGGVLLLVPSKEAVQYIAVALASLEEQLIVQSDTLSAQHAKIQFIAKYRSGKTPIWIGTGPAWTGLDLSDQEEPDPEKDFLLTDLVITRIPFSVNRSATQLAREEWMGYRAVISEALMQFKQGIGRLVRRRGLLNRNLWILDGRIVHVEYKNRMKTGAAMLKIYTNVHEY